MEYKEIKDKFESTKPYDSFAEAYDQIMCSVDYDGWADYVEMLLKKHAKRPVTFSVIDLACGTGNSTLPFARRGYDTVGIDISEKMLKRARDKAEHQSLPARFYQQDLRKLELPWEFDLALLFQDGLNYILSEAELYEVFHDVYSILKSHGLFIFDLTRPGLRCTDKRGSTSVAELDDLIMIMESSYDDDQDLWSASLTVFQYARDDFYKKYREEHLEKDHDPKMVADLLDQAGFTVLAVYPSFSFEPASSSDQKLTFVARKNSWKKRLELEERKNFSSGIQKKPPLN